MASLHLAQEILNIIYPVGSIYMSMNSTNPKNLFGGTWEAINSRFLIGTGTATGEATEKYNFQAGQVGRRIFT